MKPNLKSNVYLQGIRSKSVNTRAEKMAAVLINNQPLTELNRSQLREGLTIEGNPIVPDYSEGYSYFKEQQSTYKAPPGTPDLFLTGSFQEKMFLVLRNGVSFSSSDSKVAKLVNKYGNNIFGITAQNMATGIILVTNSYIKMIVRALKRK